MGWSFRYTVFGVVFHSRDKENRREAALSDISKHSQLDFLCRGPIIYLHLPPTRLALVARVGLSRYTNPARRLMKSRAGFFVSGGRHAA